MSIAHIISGSTITVIANFTPHVIAASHPNYERIKAMCADTSASEGMIVNLLDIPKAIESFTSGKVYVKNGKLFLDGCEVRSSLGAKIMQFVRAGDDGLAEPLKLFLENVAMNPDPRAQQDLYDWVQASGLPITGDGYVLAWKAVCEDYTSLHRRGDLRFDHRIGKRVEMPRDECDANPNVTCSSGLHFCGAAYLRSYIGGGARIVVVKIHPRDIVSFPTDYQLQKGRACGYDIVGEVPGDKVKDYYPQGAPVYRGFDAPAKPKPKFLGEAVRVGQVYRRRDGSATVITAESSTCAVDHNGSRSVYMNTGAAMSNGDPHALDLIEAIAFPLSSEDFVIGDRWVNRSGKTVTITDITYGSYVGLDDKSVVYLETGRANRSYETGNDLVFNLDYKRPKKIERNGDFAVGQVWETRNGQKVTIASINQIGRFPIGASNGGSYHIGAGGKHGFYKEPGHGPSPHDLMKLITDVA